MVQVGSSKNSQRFSISLDYRIIVLVLLAVIAGMLLIWKPWQNQATNDSRTITVTGEALIKAEPDEFVFYPRYEFVGSDKGATAEKATKKADEVIAKLKELGVPDNKLKSNVDGYGGTGFGIKGADEQYTYAAQITVTLSDRSKVQKIQDYLVTTTPTGTITPQASFSQAKRKDLEAKGRDEATKDARKKAEQSAKNLGFRITKVKSVKDSPSYGGPIMLDSTTKSTAGPNEGSSGMTTTSLSVQPGEQEIPYTVEVVYYFD